MVLKFMFGYNIKMNAVLPFFRSNDFFLSKLNIAQSMQQTVTQKKPYYVHDTFLTRLLGGFQLGSTMASEMERAS